MPQPPGKLANARKRILQESLRVRNVRRAHRIEPPAHDRIDATPDHTRRAFPDAAWRSTAGPRASGVMVYSAHSRQPTYEASARPAAVRASVIVRLGRAFNDTAQAPAPIECPSTGRLCVGAPAPSQSCCEALVQPGSGTLCAGGRAVMARATLILGPVRGLRAWGLAQDEGQSQARDACTGRMQERETPSLAAAASRLRRVPHNCQPPREKLTARVRRLKRDDEVL